MSLYYIHILQRGQTNNAQNRLGNDLVFLFIPSAARMPFLRFNAGLMLSIFGDRRIVVQQVLLVMTSLNCSLRCAFSLLLLRVTLTLASSQPHQLITLASSTSLFCYYYRDNSLLKMPTLPYL